jgi:hypothetical protein
VLGRIGAEAKAAVPALSDALQDRERVQVGKGEWLPVSFAAYAALRRIDPGAYAALCRIDPEAASKADEGRFWAFGLSGGQERRRHRCPVADRGSGT